LGIFGDRKVVARLPVVAKETPPGQVTARRIKGYLVVGAGLVITFSGVINNFLGFNPLAGTMIVIAFAAVVMASAAVIISEDEVVISGFGVGFLGLLDGFGLGHWRGSS
jgi:hypothetical protein